ncbi:MAG: hypothetical protein B7X10_00285 [Burkholderiales bacterium 21-58-4]|nr:MAG: hypothetical protein B7X10_00285 [Burkholderiales bacterium 21-58-4]
MLAAGATRYKTLNAEAYHAQVKSTSGFWMSFHELTAGYPWLVKRSLRVSPNFTGDVPRRNFFAYLFALFVPRLNIITISLLYFFIIAVAFHPGSGGLFSKLAQRNAAMQSGAPQPAAARSGHHAVNGLRGGD